MIGILCSFAFPITAFAEDEVQEATTEEVQEYTEEVQEYSEEIMQKR